MTTTDKTLNFINLFNNKNYHINNFNLLNMQSFIFYQFYPQIIHHSNNTLILLNQFITPNVCFIDNKTNLNDFLIINNHTFIEDKLFSFHNGFLLPSSLCKTSFNQYKPKTTTTEDDSNLLHSSNSIAHSIHYLIEHLTTSLHNISEKIMHQITCNTEKLESKLESLNALNNFMDFHEFNLNINDVKNTSKHKNNQDLCTTNNKLSDHSTHDNSNDELNYISFTKPKNMLERLNILFDKRYDSSNSSNLPLLSINDILENFKANNELSSNSLKNYKLAINKFAPNLSDKPFTIQLYIQILENINECKKLVGKEKIKTTTFNLYIKLIRKIIESAFSKNKLKYNSLDELNSFIYQKADNTPRKALDCENFINITEAKTKYQRFLKKLYKTNSLEHFKLWLIHAILCTRKNETIQVIKNFQKGSKTVDIKTKCQTKFTIPITPIVAKLINDIKEWINSKTDRTASEYIYQAIPKGYKKLISPHGTRALFRTIIELLNIKESFEVKEAYLNHNVLSKVQGAYMRNNYLERREKIERKWENWILNLLGKDIITTLDFTASTFIWKQKIKF